MLKLSKRLFLYCLIHCTCTVFPVQASMQAQLAQVYEQTNASPVSDYLVSEKYDGVRAIWTGEQLLTRNGNQVPAPEWFIAPLPDVWLDGELWTQRQDFEALSSIVRTQIPDDNDWRQISYMVFDMPDTQLPFEQRYKNYSALIKQIDAAHIKAIKQQRFNSHHALSEHLQALVEEGAEGLMLHLASAHHRPGRNDALLKLKPYFDAEAEVIAHLPGRGKYTDMLGALRVRNKQGIEFSVGTGFTDAERANPPPIGSVITYKYHGYTNNGLPRFASFLRIRDDLEYE
ncbi:DNA ligase [Aliidiomarina minuta]|uniref:DNA ligase n=1 Tax=Aliidiomarina minuta TaxID=880057 RepID=A0A432W923_9GAMM|nr:DNA ligase [Aliidiomarina minuta]RUO26555.1 DNA ligase [Aliidiomarina minuta]